MKKNNFEVKIRDDFLGSYFFRKIPPKYFYGLDFNL